MIIHNQPNIEIASPRGAVLWYPRGLQTEKKLSYLGY